MVSPAGALTVADVLRIAFPAGESPAACSVELPLHVIQQGAEPRWIVLGDSTNAAPVLRSWRPFKVGTRLRWSVVVSASSLGILSRVPGVKCAKVSIDLSYWRERIPGFQVDWVPVLYVGNPSHTRKVTIFFVSLRDRRIKAVGKVPLLPESVEAILTEAGVLSALAGENYLPECLFRDLQTGFAAQSWLEGKPVSRKLTRAHMDLLARFSLAGEVIRVSAQRASIARELDQTDLPFDRGVLCRALELLDFDEPLPAFIEHRDFAPWNLKRIAEGQTGAIDWEWASLRSLPCQDIFRFFYIQDALFFGPGGVWETLNQHPMIREHLRRFSIPAEALAPLAMHYQLRILAMDWRGGNRFLADYTFRQIEALIAMDGVRSISA